MMGWRSYGPDPNAGAWRVTFGRRPRCARDERVSTALPVPDDWAFTSGRLYYVTREMDGRGSLHRRTDPPPHFVTEECWTPSDR